MRDHILRRAVADDAPGLTACMKSAYAEAAARLGELPPLTADYAHEIEHAQVWVAVVGETVAGGLVLVPAPGHMQLANVAVHPDHAGRGLGRALIELAEAQAAAQDFAEIRLTTHAGMPANIALYRHLGWREIGRHGDGVAMAKPVKP